MKRNYILSNDLPQFSETLVELEGKGYCDELFGKNMAKKSIDITLIYPLQIRIAAADGVNFYQFY
jgi:hypothetical protein